MAMFREPPVTAEVEATPTEKGSDVGEISQARLMVRRFKQSKLAVGGGIVLILLYLAAALAGFLSPNDPNPPDVNNKFAAPSQLTFNGGKLGICGRHQTLKNYRFVYVTDCKKPVPVKWFVHGNKYKILGFIESDLHLMGVDKPNKLLLWGADQQGRDVFSRTLYGGQISLTIGLVGVGISTILATIIGTASGYFAGAVDTVIQRIIEIISSVPTLPLWLTIAAILPVDIGVPQRFFLITLVLSLVGWAGLARQVRGKVMSYAGADYVLAARAAGSGNSRIIMTHMIPNAVSHIVVVATLAIPATILGETSLSFLGVGMVEPAISWGVILNSAQDPTVVMKYPWMMIPAILVIVSVTAYQLLGDGVRDAVDPYG